MIRTIAHVGHHFHSPPLMLLADVVAANGRGHPAKGYEAEYLIGARLARPTASGLVHTRLGLSLHRAEQRRKAAKAKRRPLGDWMPRAGAAVTPTIPDYLQPPPVYLAVRDVPVMYATARERAQRQVYP